MVFCFPSLHLNDDKLNDPSNVEIVREAMEPVDYIVTIIVLIFQLNQKRNNLNYLQLQYVKSNINYK